MAMKATFTADFSVFYDAVQKAQTQLKGFSSDAQSVEKQLNKMGDSFSGDAIRQQALLAAKAIEDIGGATMLTAKEQERANAILDEAIAKYAALGKEAPAEVQALQAQLQAIGKEATNVGEQAGGMKDTLVEAFHNPAKAVSDLAGEIGSEGLAGAMAALGGPIGVAAIGFTALAGAAVVLTEKAAGIGANLQDMSEKTGITVPTLSRLSQAAQVAGIDINTLSDAVYKMNVQSQNSPTKFADGMEKLGLNTKEFLALDPASQLETLSTALANTSDAATRNAAGADIMGRAFKDLGPPLLKLNEALVETAGISVWTPEQAHNAEAFEMQTKALKLAVEDLGVSVGRSLLPAMLDLISFIKQLPDLLVKALPILGAVQKGFDNIGTAADYASAAWNVFTGNLNKGLGPQEESDKATKEHVKDLMEWQANAARNTKAIEEQGKATSNGIGTLQSADSAWKALTKSNEEHLAATQKNQKASEDWQKVLDDINSVGQDWRATLQGLDGDTHAEALRLLEAGANAQTVARYFGLTTSQLAALHAEMKDQAATAKLIADVAKVEDSLKGLGDQIEKVGKAKPEMDWSKELEKSETAAHKVETSVNGLSSSLEQIGTKARPAMVDIADTMSTSFSHVFNQLPNMLAGAFATGNMANVLGAVTTLGGQIGTVLGNNISKNLETAFGNIDGSILAKKVSQAISAGAAGAAVIGNKVAGSTGGQIAGMVGSLGGAAVAASAWGTSMAAAGIAGTLALGAVTLGIGAAAVGVYLLAKHFLTVSANEKEARKTFEDYAKAIGASNVNEFIYTVGQKYAAMGKSGVEAQQDIQRALDATHVSAKAEAEALQVINDKLAEGEKQAKRFNDALAGFQQSGAASFNAMSTALAYDQSSLQALGSTAMTTFATLVAGGMSQSAALAAIQPGLEQLQASYDALGLKVADAGVKALIMQANIAKDNPALIAGIDGLTASMGQLAGMGLLNSDTFTSMETLGARMYQRLQSEANAAGGATADALLPMQGFLQEAAEQAKLLGIPLDSNTQMLIDQSKELGIWHDKGKSATEALTDSMAGLVAEVQKLVDTLNAIPRSVHTDVTVSGPPSGADGYANGGVVPPKYFAGGGNVVAYMPKGSDRVPAMLTPGERVLTVQQQKEMGSSSSMVLENETTVMLDGQVLYRAMERKQQQNLLMRRKLSAA